MMTSLTGIHFLISYGCSAECDHCFLWGSPRRNAAMTPESLDAFLDAAVALETVTGVCAEGGESFLRYDLVRHFLRGATARGLKPSALTNASWVTSRELARRRVAELLEAGLVSLGVSTDQWHRKTVPVERVDKLLEVCAELGLAANRMETELGGVMFRGRAAAVLAPQMPVRPAAELTKCPHENLAAPARVHLDCYGRLHLCQGLNVGPGGPVEAWRSYQPAAHPIVAPLLEGGPYALGQMAARHGFALREGYVDACHLCYEARRALRSRFPELLGPDEMYGDQPPDAGP